LPFLGTVILAVIATVWLVRIGAGVRDTPARRRAAISRLIVGAPALMLAVCLFAAGTRAVALPDDLGRALSAALAILWVAVPVSIAATLVRDRLTAAAAADALVSRLATRPSPAQWCAMLADVSGDPSLLLISGPPDLGIADRKVVGAGRSWLRVDFRGRSLGAIDADASLMTQPELVDLIVATSGAALLDSSTRETTRLLEARLAGATMDERTRTSRDLQAGVLSRLIAMRTHAAAMVKDVGDATGASLAGIQSGIDGAISELRETISSAEPTLIGSVGVVAALRAVARRAPVRVRVEDQLTRQHPMRVQLAIYYACLEAVQNVTKHAGAQAQVTVVLSDTEGSAVSFSVTDDGPGFERAATSGGTGLFNIRERVESAGGSVTIESAVGRGTTVAGRIPDTLVGAPRAAGAMLAQSTS
jgi:signal transduction histidine kinase